MDAENYLLACHRYIELNPVRAGMVAHPAEYHWSSYRAHAYGVCDSALTEHASFRALGRTPEARAATYRELFRTELDPSVVHEIRKPAMFSVPRGNDRFRGQVSVRSVAL